jgi:glutathione S-transferase
MTERPLLWHLKVSHYNEKARWALDHKRVPHRRRAVVPGGHERIARRLTGGRTFPVLVLDGEAIGGSARIIEALERRHPHPALYPSDPEQRRRALDLEAFFDEELGPHMRRLVVHHMLADVHVTLGAFFPDLPAAAARSARAAFPLIRHRMASSLAIDERTLALARAKLDIAGERFRAEVGRSGHLAGGRFSVADLTLAALLAPAVAPPQFPYPQPQRDHPALAPLREQLAESGLLEWTRATYARHRDPSAAARPRRWSRSAPFALRAIAAAYAAPASASRPRRRSRSARTAWKTR